MIKCIACGDEEFTIIHHGTRDIEDIDVLRCKNCGMVRLSSFEHIRDGFYEDSEMRSEKEINDMAVDERAKNDIRRTSFFLSDYMGKDVLDFGCGMGGFLKIAQNYANSVAGVEKDDRLRNNLTDSGIDVRSNINEFDNNFDFISMFHVIEHLVDPYECLDAIRNHLNVGGRLIVETPNADDALLTLYDCDEFKRFSYWGCHVQLYTSNSLEKLLNTAGFDIIWSRQVQRYPLANHLYWIRHGRPGGHKIWDEFGSSILESEYERALGRIGKCDTLLMSVKKR